MAIFIMILKGIGWFLLWILLILILLVAVILFLPLRYEAYGSYLDGKLEARFRIGGLSGFLRFLCELKEDEVIIKATAFYGLWQLYPKKEKKGKTTKSPDTKASKAMVDTPSQETAVGVSQHADDASTKGSQSSQNKTRKQNSAGNEHTQNYQGMSDKEKKRRRQKSSGQPGNHGERITTFLNNIRDEGNQRAVNLMIQTMLWLLKRVKPNIHMADIDFSLGEPDLTGQATGIISMCPMAYGKRVRITPDFISEDPYIKGEALLTGRIFVIHIIIGAVKILFNKDCRTLFGK